MKETLLDGGYRHIRYLGNRCHLLQDQVSGSLEVWAANYNHASYGLIWGNTHLEFVRSWQKGRA